MQPLKDTDANENPTQNPSWVFDYPDALALNQARLSHLLLLNLPLSSSRILEVGCGVGHLSQFLFLQGAHVIPTDARASNIIELCRRYPHLVSAFPADVESLSFYHALGTFDIVFCYGLLYHVENPLRVLANLSRPCTSLLLLETMITDAPLPILSLASEDSTLSNQSLTTFGTRPSPSFLYYALLRSGFPFIYTPIPLPDHPDFHFSRLNNLDWFRDGRPLRQIFIASKNELYNPMLRLLTPNE